MITYKNFKKIIFAILCCVFTFGIGLSFLCFNSLQNDKTFAMSSSDTTKVVNIGSILKDDYATSDKVFNGNKLSTLYSLLTGNQKATFSDLETLFTRSQVTLFGSNIVKSNILNTNAKGRDIVLRFGSIDWTVTSLTKDNDGNIIATLLQLDSSTNTFKYSVWSPSNGMANLAYPANMYSTSYIRNVTLNAKGCGYVPNDTEGNKTNPTLAGANTQSETNKYAIYTMEDIAGSLTDYIVTPAKIKYQETQNHHLVNPDIAYSNPNGAWGVPEGTFKMYDNGYNINYLPVPGYTPNTKKYYSQWKDDYVWIPSMTEWSSSPKGIWGMTANQKQATNIVWQRAGNVGNNASISCIAKSGDMESTSHKANESLNYRPALHLNLTKAEEDSLYLCSIDDFNVDYNGQVQSFETLADFYNTDWVESIVYRNSENENVTEFKEAGIYYVDITLKSVEERPNVAFAGKEVSNRTHTYTFTINKKKLVVTFSRDTDGFVVANINSSEIYTDDLNNSRTPIIGVDYVSSDDKGYVFNYPNKPNKVGQYFVTAKVTNECNYQIDTSKPYTTSFTKGKTQITRPDISIKSKEYNGQEQEFPLMGGMLMSDIKVVPISDGITFDSTKSVLKVKNAGKYKVRLALADETEFEWKDGTDKTSPFELEIEVTKKPLTLTIESDSGWTWEASKTPIITITGDSYANDRTELYIYYYKSGDPTTKYDDINNNKVLSDDKKTRTITMPKLEVGTYVIGIEIFGSNYTNDCYKLVGDVKTQPFTVEGNDVTLEHPIWKCNDVVIEDTTNINYVYSGSSFNFTVDEDDLHSNGMEIDLSKGINGFEGTTSATNVGKYSAKVYVKSLQNYKPTTATHIINFEIIQAKYNLSGLTWNYDKETNNRVFKKATAQKVESTGTIPTGLTAKYTGNGVIPVGTYTTRVQFTNSNANYVTPNELDKTTYDEDSSTPFVWRINWEIEKATLVANWNDATIPKLRPVGDISLHEMVDYTYYEVNEDGSKGNEISVDEIGSDKTKEKSYIVEATLKSEFAGSYLLSPTVPSREFSVGTNKVVVQLYITFNEKALEQTYFYTGIPFNVKVNFTVNDSGLTKDDIVITYYNVNSDGTPETTGSTTIPTAVGKYHAIITVSAEMEGGTIVSEDCDNFDFEIVKGNFDVSNLKLQYTHNGIVATYDMEQKKWIDADDHEITDIKFDGLDHTIEFIGLDTISSELKANIVDSNSNGQLNFKNAGEYSINISFVYDASCYNAPNFSTTILFNIAKANVDTSNIVWGYVVNNGKIETPYTGSLEYRRTGTAEESVAVMYTLKLINVPEELVNCIKYTGDVSRSSVYVLGSYSVSYAIDYSLFNTDNFENCSMPAGLKTTLNWEITPKYLDIPTFNNSWTVFDAEIHNFAEMCGLQSDWYLYYDINVTRNGELYAGLDESFESEENREIKAYNYGKYVLEFKLKNSLSDFYWKERFLPITIDVEKIVINIDRWSKVGISAEIVSDFADYKAYTQYQFKDKDGNLVDVNQVIGAINGEFTKEIIVKSQYGDNVELVGETKHHFTTGEGGRTFVEKPTMPTLIYTGEEFNIVTYLTENAAEFNFKPTIMAVTGQITATEPGSYTIKIVLTDSNYRWEDEDANTDEIELVWKIEEQEKVVLEKPTFPELFYTGEEIDITSLIIGFNPEIMEVVSGSDIVGLNAGVYSITIRLTAMGYTWETQDTVKVFSIRENQFEEITLTWEIKKAQIVGMWNNENGYPVIDLENLEQSDLFTIKYYIGSGDSKVEVKPNDMVSGQTYSYELQLKNPNYEFKIDGEVLTENQQIKGFIYNKPQSSFKDFSEFLKDNWLYVVIAIIILFLLLTIFILAFKKRKKANKSNLDDARYNNGQYAGFVGPQIVSQAPPTIQVVPANIMPSVTTSQVAMESDRFKDLEIQQLRETILKMAKYQVASEEEKAKSDKLAKTEKMLMQFLLIEFANNPEWIPFNNQDMIDYDINDLMRLYLRAKQIKSQKLAINSNSTEKDRLLEESQNFESKVAQYNKQKEDSKYEELLKAIREVGDAQKELKNSQIKLEEKLEEKINKDDNKIDISNFAQVKTNQVEKLDFDSAFNSLPANQKRYFGELKDYALKQPNAKPKGTKQHFSVGIGNNIYVKFVIKYSTLIAVFGTTEVKLENDNSIEIAKQMIDTRVKKFQEKI